VKLGELRIGSRATIIVFGSLLGIANNSIARKLNQRGLATRKGSRWTRKVVAQVLRNRLYIGEIVYGRSYTTRKGKKVVRPKKEWVIIQGRHQGFIKKELFEKIQRFMDERAGDKNFIGQRKSIRGTGR